MPRLSERPIRFDLELDPETNKGLELMAAQEGRSKRAMSALLIRRITRAMKTNASDLERLGLYRGELLGA